MSYRKRKSHPITGEIQSGTVLEIVEANEPVIRLTLEDGTLVRVKVSIVEIMRMDNKNENGGLNYDINANLTASFIPPDEQLND